MNLHSLHFDLSNVAVWIAAHGGNGHYMGIHLWQLDEGAPPNLEPMQPWTTRTYWTPPRYSWQPFKDAMNALHSDGWVRPLCGMRSQSRHARPFFTSRPDSSCINCLRVTTERSIIALTQSEAMTLHRTYTDLRQEAIAWRAAGRPDQWPLPAQA